MGWEQRSGGRRYYTRSHKQGRRVIREYIGGGAIGEAAAAEDELRRQNEALERAAWQAQRARLDSADRQLNALNRILALLVIISVEDQGYVRYDWGRWRRSPSPRRRGDGVSAVG